MKQVESIILFDNLSIVVFDRNGKQIPELQVSPANLFAQRATKLG